MGALVYQRGDAQQGETEVPSGTSAIEGGYILHTHGLDEFRGEPITHYAHVTGWKAERPLGDNELFNLILSPGEAESITLADGSEALMKHKEH